VIEDLKPYSETRDSGLPWLGDIPAHWEIKRNGSFFQQRNAVGEPDWPILEVSLRTGVRIREFGSTKRKQVMSDKAKYKCATKGDFVYNMMRMWQGAAGIAPVDGLVSPAYVVAKPLPHTNPAYFASLFRTDDYLAEIDAFSRGIVKDRNRLYWDQFKQIPTPCPPPEEQAAIARFLAWATNRLDRAIGAKRRIIALLQEQKQAIIHRAVTRGLDPSVPLKPSGIPWLGEIPEHWEVMPVKRTCSLVRDGTHLPPARTPTGFPLLSVRNMVGGRLIRRPDDSFISKADFDKLNSSFAMYTNDVLMAVVGATLGKVSVVKDIGPFQIQRSVSVLRPRPELMSHTFLAAFLRSPRLQQHLWQSVAYSAQPGIYLGFVANIPVPVPPTIHEQVAICDTLLREQSPIDTAISRLEREIELLHEYRTRLIADVVTGKLDVREVAARLPEPHNAFDEQLEPEEEEPEFEAEDVETESMD
jgi:type I restriction enzyme S subunit